MLLNGEMQVFLMLSFLKAKSIFDAMCFVLCILCFLKAIVYIIVSSFDAGIAKF